MRVNAWMGVLVGVVMAAACTGNRGGDGDNNGGSSSGSSGASSSSSGFVGPRPGEVGSPCARNAECNSELCLASGSCTRSCADETQCPDAWTCSALPGAGRLCQCTPTANPAEICDGLDNNCNATVDENATCEDGLVCTAGACTCPPERSCNGMCADLQTDEANCGMCGRSCGAGRVCTAGQCVLDCGAQVDCGGACVDTMTSTSHCGGCGRTCGAGGTCSNGQCQCTGGATSCDGSCVNTMTNNAHCGRCGNPCTGGGSCNNGTCSMPTTTLCTETCMYTNDNECDDGGPSSMTSVCDFGTDCMDCGPRMGGSSSGGSSSSGGAPRPLGDPCTANSDCADGICATEAGDGWAGGYCTKACDTNTGNPCGTNGFCTGLGVCLKKCTTQAQCRSPYSCSEYAFNGTRTCTPVANGSGAVGDPCTTFADCGGGDSGFCVPASRGWPGGYCTQECMSGNLECPFTAQCVQQRGNSGFLEMGFCAVPCTTVDQCRSGYMCRDVNSSVDLDKECAP